MWYRRVVPLLVAGLLAGCGGGQDEAVESEESLAAANPVAALDAVAQYWETHYNMHHPDMVASVYADDAFVAPANGGVFEGPEAILGWLTEGVAGSPTADINGVETLIMGDQAMRIGTYEIATTGPDGAAMELSGSFMTSFARIDGEWKITGMVSNYDTEPPAEMAFADMPEETPPEVENEFSAVIEQFENAYNAGDAAGIAALYADDALVSYSSGPILRGPAEVQSAMAERMESGATLEIHQVGAEELDDTHAGSGGWYVVNGPGDTGPVQSGIWWNLMETQPDGTMKILWTVTNARPGGM